MVAQTHSRGPNSKLTHLLWNTHTKHIRIKILKLIKHKTKFPQKFKVFFKTLF